MKKAVIMLLALFLTVNTVQAYSGGSGTEADPYQISNAEDLIQLGETTEDYDKHFIMTANIDLTGYIFDKAVISPDKIVGISFNGTIFTGFFNGNGHVVSNLNINGAYYCGLFGNIGGLANICNLGLKNVSVIGSGDYIGGLVGHVDYGSSSIISNCYAIGTISGNNKVGGLVGAIPFATQQTLLDNYVSGYVSGTEYIGGLVGTSDSSSYQRCYAIGTVDGSKYVGGMVGYSDEDNIVSCYVISSVCGGRQVGGLLGKSLWSTTSNCFVKCFVTGEYSPGGLIGDSYNSSINNCYSSSSVAEQGNYRGALFGILSFSSVQGCFFDIQTSGTTSAVGTGSASGILGLSTADMKSSSVFLEAGWDFYPTEIDGDIADWKYISGYYPRLDWETVNAVTVPSVIEMDLKEAREYVRDRNLAVGLAGYLYSEVESGLVCSQYPFAGSGSLSGEMISVMISLGVKYSGGNGTEADPFVISNADDLISIGENPEDFDKTFVLASDIDLSGKAFSKALISYDTDMDNIFDGTFFTGKFLGNGHSVSNLIINGASFCGLFGKIGGNAYISDLNLNSVSITGSGQFTGGLIGQIGEDSPNVIVSNCNLSGNVSGSMDVGGLIGFCHSGTISDCSILDIYVSGDHYIGGICGEIGYSGNTVIDKSVVKGTVSGKYSCVGGLAGSFGYKTSHTITNSYFEGSIIGGSSVGGLIGSTESCSIFSCYAKVSILSSNNSYVGGLVGDGLKVSITNCYSTGDIIGGSYCGGLVGNLSKGVISNCYSACTVSGSGTLGGLVGGGNGTITNSYFYLYGGPDNKLGEALNDAQLQDKGSFVGFDFVDDIADGTGDIWAISSGYMPRLAWQDALGFSPPDYWDGVVINLEGDGSEQNPYLISDIEDMLEFRNNSALRFGVYSLTSDIDLSGYVFDNAFIPERFNGTFLGNGHVISNLTINTDFNNIGFLGILSGSLSNLGLENVAIVGNGSTNVGGLVGRNYGSISNCYATGNVSGEAVVGGLVGSGSGELASCYSVCFVDCEGLCCGVLAGACSNQTNCYYYVYCGPDNKCGIALDDAQLQDKSSFVGFDFDDNSIDGSNDIWTISPGYLPRFAGQEAPGISSPDYWDGIVTSLEGEGSEQSPFVISSLEDLLEFRNNSLLRFGYYSLAADIDLVGDIYDAAFIPERFNGTFKGNNHNISNITVVSDVNGVGFFSVFNGTISNLNLIDVSISGKSSVGGLAGLSEHGNITDCFISGSVRSLGSSGGLIGRCNDSSVISCYSSCSILGKDNSGGLIGNSSLNTISNCCALGPVSGVDQVGGLIGEAFLDNINQSYSTGHVSGQLSVGGVIGICHSVTINNCYTTSPVTGNSHIGGFMGEGYGSLSYCYSSGEVTATSSDFAGGFTGWMPTTMLSCFWDIQSSGMINGGQWFWINDRELKGLSTAEMNNISTFTNSLWDFSSKDGNPAIWQMSANGYPSLAWEGGPDIDNSGLVDIFDFAVLSQNWFQDDCKFLAPDFDKSGVVDLPDLEWFIENWLKESYWTGRDVLIAHWPLNETSGTSAADVSENDNPGTVYGSPAYETGVNGGCYIFDGVDDYIVSGGCQGVTGNRPRTVSAYIKAPASALGSFRTIVSWGSSTPGNDFKWLFGLDNSTGQLALATYANRVKGGPNLTDNQWHHVVVVMPSGATNVNQVKMFVDGIEIATNAGDLNADIYTAASEVTIGANNSSKPDQQYIPSNFFLGSIDDVQIYTVAITPTEDSELFDINYYDGDNFVGHWSLDEAIGINTPDCSVYNNKGLIHGTPTIGLGVVQECYIFDGVDDYVSLPGVIVPGSEPFSVCLWAKGGEANQNLICQADGLGAGRIWLGLSSEGQMRTAIAGAFLCGETNWDSTSWHHVVLLWDGARRHIYIDGSVVVEDTTDLDAPLEFADGPIYIGAHKYLGSTFFWHGSIDDVRIYKKALEPAEIAELVNMGN